MNATLYNRCKLVSLPISHVAEVGVYLPETSNVLGWVESGVRTTLVEADPVTAEKCKQAFAQYPLVSIHNLAVGATAGRLKLYRVGASTFSDAVEASPALINDSYAKDSSDSFEVDCTTFDTLDDGTIDVLSIDIEGGEWDVVKRIVSKPLVISVEMGHKLYVNPKAKEILNWMREHSYSAWFADGADIVFVKNNTVQQTFRDKYSLWKKRKLIKHDVLI